MSTNNCATCERPTGSRARCETCEAVEKNLEQYLGTLKGRQFVRRTLTAVSLRVKSRGEREV